MPTYIVTLPDGREADVIAPEGATKQEALEYAVQQYDAGAFGAPKQDTGFSLEGAIEDIAPGFLKSAERVAPALKEAAPEPSTIGGVGGAILGGMVGGIPGSIAGGSLGSGAGQLIEEAMKPGEMTAENYMNAATEAAVSLGLDVATLGAGKVAGPALRQAGDALERFSPQFKQIMDNYRVAGVPPEQAVKDVAEVGSDEAFKRSQQFLADRGATLTPGQFPNATKAEQIKEAIGRSGFVSGRNFDQNMASVNQAVNDEFNKLFNFKQASDASDLGSNALQIIEAGKKQLGATYRQGLDDVTQTLSNQVVSGKPAANQLKAYLKKFETPVLAEKKVKREVTIPGLKPKTVTETKQVKKAISSLSDETVSLIKDSIKVLDSVTAMPADTLITIQRKLMNEIDRLGDFNSGVYNKQAAQELADFSNTYREVVARQLQNVAPEAAAKFKNVNRAFSEGMGNLLPPINKNFISRANKDDFASLGKVMTSRYQPDQAKALFNSIRSAYKDLDQKAIADLPFKTANEAIDNIRSSYIKEIMPTVGDEVINIKDYAKLAKQFQNKNVQAKAKEVLGDKFVPFMDLLNTMNAASKVPESAMPTLFLRAKEYAAAGGLATAYGLGAIEGVTLGASAAAIFGIPEILARAAVNPKHVNRLKVFSKSKFDTAEEAFKKFSIIANDIMAPELEEFNRKAKESLAQ